MPGARLPSLARLLALGGERHGDKASGDHTNACAPLHQAVSRVNWTRWPVGHGSSGRQAAGHFPPAPPKPAPKPTEQSSHLAWQSWNKAGLWGAGKHRLAIVAEG